MLTDAHCHPFDLREMLPGLEDERRLSGAACAASAWNREQFEYHEALSARLEGPPVALCFAVHPQLPASGFRPIGDLLAFLETLAVEDRLDAVGETGFDLFNDKFRQTETVQDECFRIHLELARQKGLPLVLHIRRAMHKVFAYKKELRSLPAVVFHSYSGTKAEGESILRQGINAYFSFGNTILLNHKEAIRCCSCFPADRLLLETDAPYQPLRGMPFSRWDDLVLVLREAARLRNEAGSACGTAAELERIIEGNYFRVYGTKRKT